MTALFQYGMFNLDYVETKQVKKNQKLPLLNIFKYEGNLFTFHDPFLHNPTLSFAFQTTQMLYIYNT